LSASIYIWFDPPDQLGYWPGLILTAYLGVVLFIDLEHRLILHPTSMVGAIIGLISGTLAHGFADSIMGGLGGLLIMLVFYFIGTGFARFRARRMRLAGLEPDDEEALGAGDVILVTILGLTLGWPLIWFGLLLGILLGGAVSLLIVLWLVVKRRYGQNALMMFIPYGPYFIVSAYVIIFFPGLVSRLLPA
jgi:prepilin signal peptidase PulO-like enzyme (type II secretory pathway)